MDEIDKNNIMRACLDLNLINFPFTSSDVENRKRLYNFAYKKVVLESIENYKEAKKIVFEQATTPQSLNAFRKFAYEKKIGLRKVGMIKDYIKPWTKETADDFVNKIPELVSQAIKDPGLFVIFDKKRTQTAIAEYRNPNIWIYPIRDLQYSKEQRITSLVHELGHHLDFAIGGFIWENNPENRDATFSLSGRLIDKDKFINSFFNSKSDATSKRGEYLSTPTEIYTRIKKLQKFLSPKTGFVNFKMLKDFINNDDPNKFKQHYDVEMFMDYLNLSTDQKIQEFVDFMNSIAKTDLPQTQQVSESMVQIKAHFRRFL
mgnify:FL=1